MKNFDKNKRYIFKRDLLIKWCIENDESMDDLTGWEKDIDNKKVKIIDDMTGLVGAYLVISDWCEEAQ